MGEIINLHIGQCGVQVAAQFWPYVASEYHLDQNLHCAGSHSPHHYFHESSGNVWEPRAVIVDTDSNSVDWLCAGAAGRMFSSEMAIGGRGGCDNLWAKGMYTDGVFVADVTLEQIRKQAEKCDRLAGFHITHSLGGGTGSGLGCWVLQRLREYFCSSIVQTFSVFPQPDHSDSVLEVYNSVLSFSELSQHADEVMVLDNKALGRICSRYLQVEPQFSHMNTLISHGISNITCPHRFPSTTSCSFRKLQVHLTPYPSQHFHFMSCAPLLNQSEAPKSAFQLVDQLMDPGNTMCSLDPRAGIYRSAVAIARGDITKQDLEAEVGMRQDKWSPYFLPYLQDRIHAISCKVPEPETPLSACFIGNSSAIGGVLKRIAHQYDVMLRRRAYLQYYENQGMDRMEFTEARSAIEDIIGDYEMNSEL